jgi:hypothetical protein
MKKKYNIQIGGLFYVPFSQSTILITDLPNDKTFYYRGLYSFNTEEKNVGTHAGINDAINNGEWIYYPVVE